MKKINLLCVLTMLSSQVHAEATPAGGTPTFYNANGQGFTYYDINGNALPPGTKIFLGIDSRGGPIMNDAGQSTGGVAYDSKESATYWSKRGSECSDAVFGPGPAANPCTGGSSASGAPSASGTITVIDEDAYNKKVFELTSVLYGASEIGAKSCKPAGDAMPGSLDGFFNAVKTYATGEATRDKLLTSRLDVLQKKVQDITNKGSTTTKDLQLEAIQLQIDTVDASIESVNGSSGRIPLREKLLLATLEATNNNVQENTKTVTAFKNLVDVQFVASVKQAEAACERKKKVQKCETVDEVETCVEVEVKDPVPECSAALSGLAALRSGPTQSYGMKYLDKMPSTPLNNEMQEFEEKMTSGLAAIPKSSDSDYDWHSPVEAGLKPMKIARKASGAKCPEGPKKTKNASGDQVVTTPEVISKAAASFLERIGAPADSTITADTFGAAWGEADNVIGQAAYRAEYFAVVQGKVNGVLAIDRIKLLNLQITKAKLEKYLNDIKNSLQPGTGSGSLAKAATTSGPAATVSTGVKLGSSTASNNQVSIGSSPGSTVALGAALQGAGTQTTGLIGNTNNPTLPLKGTQAKALSTLGGSTIATTNSGLGLSAQALAQAKKTISNISANEKKLSKALAASSTSGASTSSGTTSEKTKNDDDKFSKLLDAMTKNQSSFNANAGQGLAASMDKAFDKLDSTAGAPEIYKSASAAGSRYYDTSSGYAPMPSGGGSPRYSEKSMGYVKSGLSGAGIKSTTSTSSGTSGSRSGSTYGSEDSVGQRNVSSDAKILSQSIVAKKSKNKDEYNSADSDSLFERVTKAYIRNYEKVEEVPEAGAGE